MTGDTYVFVQNPRHHWHWFPLMSPDEVILLKNHDSAGDGIAHLAAHSAFDDPTSPPDARPRRSIELSSLVSFLRCAHSARSSTPACEPSNAKAAVAYR
ncbi:CmcJ/NvfI family oxidoreductase [Paraburkholderia strydomiana]|uniref:CmcJ/NvfI family oxidoreductase n=1 Tax=Paraburkholderia strydomiana TaxID=1245417 RepID=UPI0038BB7937